MEYIPQDWSISTSTTCPVNKSRSGYGSKLPTSYVVNGGGKKNRRVYAICWSNSATFYVIVKGKPVYIENTRFINS